MNKRGQEHFIFGVAVISFIAATLILLSATSTGHTLDGPDPFLILSSRQVFYLASGLGFILSAFLLVVQNQLQIKLLLIAWLTTNFLIYKTGLLHYHEPNYFSCLGNLDETLQISPNVMDWIGMIMLVLMLGGSCVFLILDWFDHLRVYRGTPHENISNDEGKN